MWYGGPREVKLMANIKSARKRIRVSEKRRLHNAMITSRMRTSIRRFNEAVETNDTEIILASLNYAFSVIDKAATKGVIHKNNAARKKAQLSRRLNAIENAAAE